MRILLSALLIGALVPAVVAASPDQDARRMTAVFETKDPGQALFVRQGCYQCHGLAGQGSNQSGPSLSPLRLDEAAFRAYVRHPRGVMPPYGVAVLPDGDLARIEAYVRALPVARPYAAIPMLAATAHGAEGKAVEESGDLLYARTCAACHGASREGGVGPSLKDEGKKHDAAAIAQLIKSPPPRMPRLYPAALSDAQVASLANFLMHE